MKTQPQPPAVHVQAPPEDEIRPVQGQLPDSINEWYVALALDKLDIPYHFQVPLNGGRSVRGGQVIDFVVFNPRPVPVFVQGAYWHNIRTDAEDQLKQAEARAHYNTEPILLMEDETNTKDKALRAVREKVGV